MVLTVVIEKYYANHKFFVTNCPDISMDRDALENRITASFIDKLESDSDISNEFPKILQEDLSRSSFGDDETIISSVIEAHEE